jgi:hypothetical protein
MLVKISIASESSTKLTISSKLQKIKWLMFPLLAKNIAVHVLQVQSFLPSPSASTDKHMLACVHE